MLLPDVNILIGAHRQDAVDHVQHRAWLESIVNGDEVFGISELVLSAMIRIVTLPGVFDPPSEITEALAFADSVRSSPACIAVQPGPRHWEIFSRLCKESRVRGNLVPDAYLAALAIESGSEWITMDGDFARFDGLRWSRPF